MATSVTEQERNEEPAERPAQGLQPEQGEPERAEQTNTATRQLAGVRHIRDTWFHRRGCTVMVLSGCSVRFIAAPTVVCSILPARLTASP